MEDQWTFEQWDCHVQYMASWLVVSKQDEKYLIQGLWPLEWESTEDQPIVNKANAMSEGAIADVSSANTFQSIYRYIVDGNAMMRSATDINYDSPKSPDGKPNPQEYGGADAFLHFITNTVHHFVFSSIFPRISVCQTALFGHSFGALFALHALYTAPASFDAYLAASPSIWWNDGFLLQEEEQFYNMPEPHHQPSVWMAYGSLEQSPIPQKNQSLEEYEKRLAIVNERLMGDNCDQMFVRLLQSGRLRSVVRRKYEDEDHGSVVAGALSGANFYFLDQGDEE
ncbi:esterase [Penicillium samsonianum]|uniref:esterase n=1 Tax=Penicillium samsonianum TaxID=1882272 RepID=UPI00254750E0|nr:esterase [Penicillium samsonianum]KAJ6124393.1 esterase [Penicillium samsonianum]